MKPAEPGVIYTIGHSTLSLDDFVGVLRHYGIQRLIDIRTIPRSRHNPQFNSDNLAGYLRNRRINYRHMKELGGLRHPLKDSINTGWHNASFRGFADYMQTTDFAQALQELIVIATEKPCAIMCAEAVPWRCHRSLVGDALLVAGWRVMDIYSLTSLKEHQLTRMARISGNSLFYPAEEQDAGGKAD